MKKKKILKKRRRLSLKQEIAIIAAGVVILIAAVIIIVTTIQPYDNIPDTTETVPIAEPEEKSTYILLDKETNIPTQYSFELLSYDEIESELLLKWIGNSIASETTDGDNPVYYALYNNSSDNLDIYLFMPAARELIGDVSHSIIRVTEANTALLIYIDTDDNHTHTKESKDLILHIQAISGIATARNEKLIINGVTYTSANTTFTALA